MNNLPSILGGLAQGFVDFGKSAVDLFGTGGASIADLIESAKTGQVTSKNSDDFRKWLYQTDDTKDAAAKGLGTALNGAQTVLDYIPGIGAVTKNPLFNAGQGALGGLADEFKTYGKDYDLGRAGQRAAISAGGALASSGLADALKKSANPLMSSGAVQGLARGATGGAISGGGYAAIDGGDIYNSALQGAGMGALIGGATGLAQDFKPAKTYDVALTDEEKAARIANAKNMLANEQNPERIAELNDQIKRLGGTLESTLVTDDKAVNDVPDYLGDEKYNSLVKKAKNYKSLDRFEKMNNPIKGSEIWGEKPTSIFQRDDRAVRVNMFPNEATKGTGLTKQYLLNMFKDAYDQGITRIIPSYGIYTDEGASFMSHLADQGWLTETGGNGYKSYEIAPKIVEWEKTNPLVDIYNAANGKAPKNLEATLSASDLAINNAGGIDMSGAGPNSKYFIEQYGDAITKAGADTSRDAMSALMAKRGNKNMVRDAFMTQQDTNPDTDMLKVFREYGGNKPAGRQMLADALTDASAAPPELVTYHGVDTDKLKKALNNFDGDVINPSLQVVNPETNPGTKYGDVILLGDKDMFFNKGRYGVLDAEGKTNAYSRDVYSPRVPNYEEKNGNRYIEGTKTLYTPENVSNYMNKQGVKSVESNWATPGSVAATQSHRFTNLADILDYADKLGPKDANRKAFDDFGEFLSKEVWDYAEKTGHMSEYNPYMTVDNITTEIQDALNGKYQPDDFYGLRTQEGQKLLSDIRQEINKLPTDYFELKMNRPVKLNEFSGAILPNGYDDAEVLNALKNAGVNVVGNYDAQNMEQSLQKTLKSLTKGKNRFTTPYMLGLAGLLGGGAYMASQDKEKEAK